MPSIGSTLSFAPTGLLRASERHGREIQTSLERLATGRKVNRASDDPAGSAAATRFDGRAREIELQLQSNQLEEYRYSAVSGALQGVGDLLNSLKAAVVTAANTGGLSSQEREAQQIEADSIIEALNYARNTTRFNGNLLLTGYLTDSTSTITVPKTAASSGSAQSTPDPAQPPGTASLQTRQASIFDLRTGGEFNLLTGDLEAAQKIIDKAIESNSTSEAAAGLQAKNIRLDNERLAKENEAVAGSLSQILDADFASEVAKLVRAQVLEQATNFSIIAARNLQAQTVLSLLKNTPKVDAPRLV